MSYFEEILLEWKEECGIDSIQYSYNWVTGACKIYTNKPGVMIGKYGSTVNKYKAKLKITRRSLRKVKFVSTDKVL